MKERKYGEGRKRSRGKWMREMEKCMKGEGEWGNKGSEEEREYMVGEIVSDTIHSFLFRIFYNSCFNE